MVVGSGIAAAQLSPGDVGLATAGELDRNSVRPGRADPAVRSGFRRTLQSCCLAGIGCWVDGPRTGIRRGNRWLCRRSDPAASAGAMLANVMFDRQVIEIATKDRVTDGHLVGEVVATAGLIALIFALARTGGGALSAAAVGAYIGAAYWFTSSTSFANPAVTVGRMFSDTFAGIAPDLSPRLHRRPDRRRAYRPGTGRRALPRCRPHRRRSRYAEKKTLIEDRKLDQADCVVPLHPQRRPFADGRQILQAISRGPSRRLLRRLGTRRPAQPRRYPAMAEKGIDITGQQPKRWTNEMVQAADVVVTMGCGDTCPFIPGRRYEDWLLPDPAGQPVEAVRPVRERSRGWCATFLSHWALRPCRSNSAA